MLSDIFGGLAAKIMLGVIVALILSNVTSCVLEKRSFNDLDRQFTKANARIEQLNKDKGILQANQGVLESSLNECTASVQATADARNTVAAAGVKALQQVQQAGKSVEAKAHAIDAMPKATCEDAFNILKAD